MQPLAQVTSRYAWASTHLLWIACALTLAFTALARRMRGVTRSGAVAGAVVCFLLYAGAGAGAFLALILVFALAWITTRWGYQRKQKLGTAEKRDGRTASQVLANLAIAASCAVLHVISGQAIYFLALASALSEAAADTVSSEVGQARATNARLITTWQTVPAGTDGGITGTGTLAGIGAAAMVSSVCAAGGLVPWNRAWIPLAAAFCGTLADSFLGALLERRGLLNNDAVNFLSTSVAAAIAFLLA